MIIVIDAYNILKQLHSQQFIDQKTRESFIRELKYYADKKKHKLVIVFDGGEFEWTRKERYGNTVSVIFSGRHETADQFIMHYLNDHKMKDLLLVSSDHELGLYASRVGISSINALDFYAIIQEGKQRNMPRIECEIQGESYDLDMLMEEASQVVPHKSEDFRDTSPRINNQGNQISKIERKLWNKLKKL